MLTEAKKISLFKDYYSSVMTMDPHLVKLNYVDNGNLHEGFFLDDHIKYDIDQYVNNHEHFKLFSDLDFYVQHTGTNGLIDYFSVLNSEGKFVFEIPVCFSDGGKLLPNCSRYNIVPKTLFNKFRFKRQFAIWCPQNKQDPFSVIAKGTIIENGFLIETSSYDEDSFKNFSFTIPDDDLSSKNIKFIIFGESSKEKVSVRFCGRDHPFFIDNNYPIITDNSVQIDDTGMIIWSLSVFLDSGEKIYLPFPKSETLYFNNKVVKVVLTDALDNDWEVLY